MLRSCVLLMLCVCAAVSAPAQGASAKWWLSPDTQAELHLTTEQVKKIDAVFESNLSQRRILRQQLDDLDAHLRALLDGANADDVAAAALISRAEAARARRNVARMMMLYRMRQLLTADQRRWFDHRVQRNSR